MKLKRYRLVLQIDLCIGTHRACYRTVLWHFNSPNDED